jgi:hypothetical protein
MVIGRALSAVDLGFGPWLGLECSRSWVWAMVGPGVQ